MPLVDAFARLVQVFVECFTGFVEGHGQECSLVVGCLSVYLSLIESSWNLVDKFSCLKSLQ